MTWYYHLKIYANNGQELSSKGTISVESSNNQTILTFKDVPSSVIRGRFIIRKSNMVLGTDVFLFDLTVSKNVWFYHPITKERWIKIPQDNFIRKVEFTDNIIRLIVDDRQLDKCIS